MQPLQHYFFTFLANGSTPSPTSTGEGQPRSPSSYHPPLPPKPSHFKKSSTDGANAAAEAASLVHAEERELLRELIFVFQGIEGVILKRDSTGSDVPGFSLHSSYRNKFTPSVIHLTLRLAELGWLFNVVHQFCEQKSMEKDVGLICQSFVTALKEELSEYYLLLTKLEMEYLNDESKDLTLIQLTVFTLEPLRR